MVKVFQALVKLLIFCSITYPVKKYQSVVYIEQNSP